jgi:archaellin
MATYTKLALQPAGTTGTGLGVLVAATATAGTAIHTASTTTTTIDEIWLYAVNTSSSSVKLTIEWGEATAPNGNIEVTVLPEAGLVTIIPGLLLQGNATAKVVRAFAATANVIVLHGFVNRITV